MRRIHPEDLTINQLHNLLVERRRRVRRSRLEHFYLTGRVKLFIGEASVANEFQAFRTQDRIRRWEIQPRTWLDEILFVIELLAVVGLVVIVTSGLSTLSTLNKTVAASLQLPTVEPTPMVQAVILPDGHTPPTGPGGARPNDAEIPEHLRPLWQSFSQLPTPRPAMEQAIRIQVPTITVDAPVVQGDSWDQLKKGAGQQIGTPNPGSNGNIVISGHNDVYGEVFRYLDRLSPGDKVILFTSQRQYTYVITETQMVEPTAVEVMAQTPDARVTLISCHPYLVDDHRIVVSAVLQGP